MRAWYPRSMKLYTDLAAWWPLVSAPAEYAEEAEEYRRILAEAVSPAPREVLELGSGGGNNASHLKRWFRLTLVDLAPGMLAVSRTQNPECVHVEGDMRSVRLGRTFDAVFVHDAIMYMTSEADLAAAMATAVAHARPGGAVLFVPDATAENFRPGADLHGDDEADAPPGSSPRGVRYLEWQLPPAPGASFSATHFAFLLRDRDGSVRVVHDEHRLGVFPRATWLRLMRDLGLDAEMRTHTLGDGVPHEAFVGIRH